VSDLDCSALTGPEQWSRSTSKCQKCLKRTAQF